MFATGTLINALAILVGGAIGLSARRQMEASSAQAIKFILAMITFLAAGKMIWDGISGSFLHVLMQFGTVLLALVLGNALGRLLRLQKGLNRFGRMAEQKFSRARDQEGRPPVGEGFMTCTLLFCVGPMAILGSVQDGLLGDYKILAIKAALDGLATLAFASTFGWGVLLAVIPVVAYQGTITLLARWLSPLLDPTLLDSVNVAGGMLLMCLPLVILEIRRVPMADYLPSLAVAPLLAWMWW